MTLDRPCNLTMMTSMETPMSEPLTTTERMDWIAQVATEIKEAHQGEDWRGEILCPACSGILNAIHSGTDGRTHGRCETKDCLKWTE